MRRTAGALGAVLAMLVAATPLTAQQRRVLSGVAKDAAGEPLAGADVRFVFVARLAEHGDPTDDRTVRTDAQGRFRAELLPCAPYRVWCLGPPADDGARPASELRLVDSSPFLVLHARSKSLPHTLRIEGLAAWATNGPFRIRVLPGGVQLPEDSILVADGMATIPAQPCVPRPTSPALALQLIDPRGEVLGKWEPDPDEREWTWTIPPPTTLQVRVVERFWGGDGSDGVADVEVFELTSTIEQRFTGLTIDPPIRYDWRSVGRTDANGWIRDVRAMAPQPSWRARGPKGSDTTTTHWGTRDLRTLVDGQTHLLKMRTDHPQQLHLVTNAPRVAAQRTLIASNGDLQSRIQTDEQGRAQLPQGDGIAIAADADPAWQLLLPENLRQTASTPPVAFSTLILPPRQLNPNWLLQFELTTANGSPPTNAQLILCSRAFANPSSWHAIPDQAGRLSVAATKDEWLVFAHDAEAACVQRIAKRPEAPIRLTLQPLPLLRGQVLDELGRPVANARLESVQKVDRAEPLGSIEEAVSRVAMWRNEEAIARCTTAVDGTFECRFLLDPLCRWLVRFRLGDRTSATFELEARDELVETLR